MTTTTRRRVEQSDAARRGAPVSAHERAAAGAPEAGGRGVPPRATRRLVRLLQVVAITGAVVASGLVALHSPLLAMRHVVIVGADHETQAEVLQTSGLVGHPPLIDVAPAVAAARLLRLPYVADATVERVWPSAVRVVITERQAIAFTTLGAGRVALLDASGRVLAEATSPPLGLVAVDRVGPVPLPGSELDAVGTTVTAAAAAIPASLLNDVRDVSRTAADGLVLQLSHGPLVILGTSTQLREKYVALATLMDSAAAAFSAAKTLDVRVPGAPVLTP